MEAQWLVTALKLEFSDQQHRLLCLKICGRLSLLAPPQGAGTCCCRLAPSGHPICPGVGDMLPGELAGCPKVPFLGKKYFLHVC